MPFNHDDRVLLRAVSQKLDLVLTNQQTIFTRLNDLTTVDVRVLAELIALRTNTEAMLQILTVLAKEEDDELHQLDRITGTLTSP